jgi:hypothetical protein
MEIGSRKPKVILVADLSVFEFSTTGMHASLGSVPIYRQ